jgi:putative addiction module component (TIGR02574 family)
MTVTEKKQVARLVAKMKPGERVELADQLYAGLPNAYLDSVNRAWEREIDRRLDEYEAGKIKTIPSREVHAGVRRRLNEIKARRLSSRRPA